MAEVLLAISATQLQPLIPQGAPTLAAVRDVGKVSPGFQVKCHAWLEQWGLSRRAETEGWAGIMESDHARVSQSTVQQLLKSRALFHWAAAVGAHHGRIKGETVLLNEPWEAERVRLVTELAAQYGALPDVPPAYGDAQTWFVAGVITVADWIGSDEQHFPYDACWDIAERREAACELLGKSVGSLRLSGRDKGSETYFLVLPTRTACKAQRYRVRDQLHHWTSCGLNGSIS